MGLILSPGAQPSDEEKEIYGRVEAVLSQAPGIVEELRAYQGAGEAIRNVSLHNYGFFF